MTFDVQTLAETLQKTHNSFQSIDQSINLSIKFLLLCSDDFKFQCPCISNLIINYATLASFVQPLQKMIATVLFGLCFILGKKRL